MKKPVSPPPFYTIGHSNRSLEEFIELLRAQEIAVLVDIRTIPRSRANPQFNQETLPADLGRCGIEYRRIAGLGGLRGKTRGVAPELNGFWENESFHRYADYALTDAFREGLGALREIGRQRRSAIMCAEAVWWRCHRRIVADYLLAAGEVVWHIMAKNRLEAARLTDGAVIRAKSEIIYPPRQRLLGIALDGEAV